MTARRVISGSAVLPGAMRHFLRHASLDMELLAAELAVSRATLYRVAGSRDALLGEVFWGLGRRLLDQARAERTKTGADGVLEVSWNFAARLWSADAMTRFLSAEPQTAARVLFTPVGEVHRRVVVRQRDIFVEAGIEPPADRPDDLLHRAFLYVRLMESVLYGDLIAGYRVDPVLADDALRALLVGGILAP